MNLDETTVVIAGGGPSGLAAAAELARHGVRSLVLEPRAEVSHGRPRAKTTSARTMEHFRRWGVADALRAAAPLTVSWSQRVTFCTTLTGRRIADFDGVFGLVVGRDDLFAEPGQQVTQPVVEQVLRDHVAANPRIDLRAGWRALSVEEHDDHIEIVAGGPGRVTSTLRASYLLGCDGPNSVVRNAIGARYIGESDPRPNFNVVFRAPELETPLADSVQYWVVDSAAPGILGRIDLDGTWWAILPGISREQGISSASELVVGLVGDDVELEVLTTDSWTANMLIASSFGRGRVFLVGESAHLNPPWGGHGYNTCVGDAVNIAWKIGAVEQGWGSPELLATYERERRPVVEETVAAAARNMTMLAGDLAHDGAAIREAKKYEFHSLGLVLGYSYAGSPIVQAGPGTVVPEDPLVYSPSSDPGGRLPHHWMPDGTSLYDHLGTGFSLLGPLGRDAVGVETCRAAANAAGIPLTMLNAPTDYPWRDEFLLVRPDQHVAWRSRSAADVNLAVATGRIGSTAGPS